MIRSDEARPAADLEIAMRDSNDTTGDLVLPVAVEQLEIHKQVVETGRGIRLTKRIHDDVVAVDEALMQEEVVVERVPIGRVVSEAPIVRHEGDTMIVPVLEERLVTKVELVLVEEIRVTRKQSTSPFKRDVVLRREEVTVERFDDTIADAPVVQTNGPLSA